MATLLLAAKVRQASTRNCKRRVASIGGAFAVWLMHPLPMLPPHVTAKAAVQPPQFSVAVSSGIGDDGRGALCRRLLPLQLSCLVLRLHCTRDRLAYLLRTGRFFSPFCEPVAVQLVDAAGDTPLDLALRVVEGGGRPGEAKECVALLRSAGGDGADSRAGHRCASSTVPKAAGSASGTSPSHVAVVPASSSSSGEGRASCGPTTVDCSEGGAQRAGQAAQAQAQAAPLQPDADSEYEYVMDDCSSSGSESDTDHAKAACGSGSDGDAADSDGTDEEGGVDYYRALADRIAAGLPVGLGSLHFYAQQAQRAQRDVPADSAAAASQGPG